MSNLVTVISKIYDASGKYVINLNVKSRYKGSSRENSKKTDKLTKITNHAKKFF